MPEEGCGLSEHYFSERPASAHARQEIHAHLRGRDYVFITDRSVFSRDRVDFGSQLLIETMSFPDDAKVLDLGCGYGPIGIVAADLAPRGFAYLCDINARAVELARENIALNRIRNAGARVSDGFADLPSDLVFDAVVSNPPIRAGKATVYALLDAAAGRLAPGGSLWVVVGNKQGADSLQRHLEEAFAEVGVSERRAGFRVLRASSPRRP